LSSDELKFLAAFTATLDGRRLQRETTKLGNIESHVKAKARIVHGASTHSESLSPLSLGKSQGHRDVESSTSRVLNQMRTIEQLVESVQREAKRADFPVDVPIYERVGKDPLRPILFAGSLEAPVCVFGRDLGKDEVAEGQPLIGAGGRLVRVGVYEAWNGEPPPKTDRRIESALEHVLLSNTVPYKPPGNKAYATSVKERFRPYIAELLSHHWKGDKVITLGTEAFQWFVPYADAEAFQAFWKRDDRYEAEIGCVLKASVGDRSVEKPLTLMPLPHPSPLNQRWYKQFPELLARRLSHVRKGR
jgi:uracil-DNA glycosylase